MKNQPDGIVLSCISPLQFKINENYEDNIKLEYKDENSREYKCVNPKNDDQSEKIYVKFRSESRAAVFWVFYFIWSQETRVNYECV